MESHDIFETLRHASHAYYETGNPIMDDDTYDALLEKARLMDPENPYFLQVGAHAEGAVKLPAPMPSLRKVKPDTLASCSLSGPFVVSEKLDGISALWITGHSQKPTLYLRGNGLEGPSVSYKQIQGLVHPCSPSIMVRGELIVPRAAVQQGTLARNWVNGLLHRKDADIDESDKKKIQFVAYQVIEPRNLTRSQQFTWLQNQGFLLPWHLQWTVSLIKEKESLNQLKAWFQERRSSSIYETDGLVIGQDSIPLPQTDVKDPKDCVAFKMPVQDQCAQTVVLAVEWASSLNKKWIPRIKFEPVKIGTASIEYCSGFNLKFIQESSLGPGAVIVVRRSGDVIPVVDHVITPAPQPQLPPEGRWEQVGCDALDTTKETSPEQYALMLTHTLQIIGVPGIQKTTSLKLVEAGLRTIQDIRKAPLKTLQTCLGPKKGQSLKDELDSRIPGLTLPQWAHAFPSWPAGCGERRLALLFEKDPDVRTWPSFVGAPDGMSWKSLKPILDTVPAFLSWLEAIPISVEALLTTPIVAPIPVIPVVPVLPIEKKGFVVFSGYRDEAFASLLLQKGWTIQERITKQTTVLLVPDNGKETTKVVSARDQGVRIVTRSQSVTLL